MGTLVGTLSLATLSLTTYTLGVLFLPAQLILLFLRPISAPPVDSTLPESVVYTEALKAMRQALPLLTALCTQPDALNRYDTCLYQNIPAVRCMNSLIASMLRGVGLRCLRSCMRGATRWAASRLHFGHTLCGHNSIMYGAYCGT